MCANVGIDIRLATVSTTYTLHAYVGNSVQGLNSRSLKAALTIELQYFNVYYYKFMNDMYLLPARITLFILAAKKIDVCKISF